MILNKTFNKITGNMTGSLKICLHICFLRRQNKIRQSLILMLFLKSARYCNQNTLIEDVFYFMILFCTMIRFVQKFGVREQEVHSALLSGDPHDQLAIAYHLIVDNKRIADEAAKAELRGIAVLFFKIASVVTRIFLEQTFTLLVVLHRLRSVLETVLFQEESSLIRSASLVT